MGRVTAPTIGKTPPQSNSMVSGSVISGLMRRRFRRAIAEGRLARPEAQNSGSAVRSRRSRRLVREDLCPILLRDNSGIDLRLFFAYNRGVSSCRVAFTDGAGVTHSVAVAASSMYEAAVLGLAEFKKCGFAMAM